MENQRQTVEDQMGAALKYSEGPKSMGAVDFLRDTLKTQHPEHSNGFSDLSEHPDYKNAGVKCFYYDGRLPLKILHDLNMRLINGGFKDSVVISR